MTEEEFGALATLGLEVTFGISPWATFGERVRQRLDASAVTLMVGPADGSSFVDYMDRSDGESSDAARYKPLDPSLPTSIAIAAQRLEMNEVAHVFEMLPEQTFRRSAYYADFAKRAGFYHRLGFSGIRGGTRMAPFGVHRAENARPFDEVDRRHLLALKPIVKQALALRPRVSAGLVRLGAGLSLLDATAEPTFVLDGERRVVGANAAAERLCVGPGVALRLLRGTNATAGAYLGCSSRAAEAALDRLVRAVAVCSKPGGVMSLCTPSVPPPGLLLQLMPVPSRLIDGCRVPGIEPGIALLLVRDLRRTSRLSIAVVRDTFALSPSEAAVACAIADGMTAAQIAADRAVAPDTVRSQIRSILGKTGATGLRDLERILALLPRAPE